jgi:mono/diheme cytochrome c family protein
MRSTHSLVVIASLCLGACGAPPDAPEASAGSPAARAAEGGAPSTGDVTSPGAGSTSSSGTPGAAASGGRPSTGGAATSCVTSTGGAAGGASTTTGGADAAAGAAGEPWLAIFNLPAGGCAQCHGPSGDGIAMKGPEIVHPSRDLFLYLVRHGEPQQLARYEKPMAPFTPALIADPDLDALFAWLSARPQPTTGAELFADYCSYCHGPDGRGGDKTIAYASAYHSAPFRRQGAEFRDYVRKGHLVDDMGMAVPVSARHEYMPAFAPEQLSDAEIKLIEAWLPK